MTRSKPRAAAPRPSAQKARRHGAPKNWRATFLATLADTSNVTAAAERAVISLSWAYKTRREDLAFARQWSRALCEGYDNLEMELLHRLRSGEARDGDGRKFDNATAFRLLIAHREAVAREKGRRADESEEEILASINAKIDAMRQREAESAAALAQQRRDGPGAEAGA